MAIKSIELENFTVLENIKCDFSPGINIIIGENGTGKTHLLKILYAFCKCQLQAYPGYEKPKDPSNSLVLFGDFSNLLLECFQINNGLHLFSSENGNIPVGKHLSITVINDNNIYRLSAEATNETINDSRYIHFFTHTMPHNDKPPISTVFIPAKEMLSHSKGLTSLYNEYKMPFDATLIDIINKAQFPNARSIPNIAKNILPQLENIIEGTVVEENDEFFIEKIDGRKTPFALETEGIKKIGLLWKLLVSKRITDDTVLIWDEPENSLNPELVPILVDILLELSRGGVQIFIATHDYNLARYFDIRRDKIVPVMFHNLSKKEDERINCDSSERYLSLPNNPLEKTGEELFNAVAADAMGVWNNE